MQVNLILDTPQVHVYNSEGTFDVVSLVSNLINMVSFNCSIQVLEPVVDFLMTVSRSAALFLSSHLTSKLIDSAHEMGSVLWQSHWKCFPVVGHALTL